MKILESYEGGHPLALDDLDYMQTGFAEVIEHVCRSLGDIVTLWGAKVTKVGSTYTVTEGAIFWNFEVFKVDAGTVEEAGVAKFVVSVVSEGTADYQDAATKVIYKNRKLVLATAATSGGFNYNDAQPPILQKKLAGGTTGQKLIKHSGANFDFDWTDVHEVSSGGTTGDFLVKQSNTPFDYGWQNFVPVSIPVNAPRTGSLYYVKVGRVVTVTFDLSAKQSLLVFATALPAHLSSNYINGDVPVYAPGDGVFDEVSSGVWSVAPNGTLFVTRRIIAADPETILKSSGSFSYISAS